MAPYRQSRLLTYALPWPIVALLPQLLPDMAIYAMDTVVPLPPRAHLHTDVALIASPTAFEIPELYPYWQDCTLRIRFFPNLSESLPSQHHPLPCHPESLRQAILLATMQGSKELEIPISPTLLFYPTLKLLHDADRPILLTEKEAELLLLLCEHRGQKLDHRTLIHTIWGYKADIPTNTLPTHIHRLRQKLGKDAPLLQSEAGYYSLDTASSFTK